MCHKPIQLTNVGFFLPHKTCFDGFSAQIPYGTRIAILGQNGCGKSTLLKIVQGILEPSRGEIYLPTNVNIGYVPQLIEAYDSLSGGVRFNKVLSEVLETEPNLLLLDEPTNHLDMRNRQSFLKRLRAYRGTLILASHDVDLLRHHVDILWHIDKGKIHIFSGNYEDYMNQFAIQRSAIAHEIKFLKKQKSVLHQILMKEQVRASKSRCRGEKNIEQRKWPTVVSKAKAGRATNTSDKLKKDIESRKEGLLEKLSKFKQPEIIAPKFNLCADNMGDRIILSIRDGSVGYENNETILSQIHLQMRGTDRVAIIGNNGSGKSTLIKSILGMPNILKLGEWFCLKIDDMGYLDQHYQNIFAKKSVLENVRTCLPTWELIKIRRFLSDFLFKKNEEVNLVAEHLSGGEKVRLSLAMIAAKNPKLLILDEITNNLDLTTKEHVIQVLTHYPGAMLVISHDEDFLRAIEITDRYVIKNSRLERE